MTEKSMETRNFLSVLTQLIAHFQHNIIQTRDVLILLRHKYR